MNINKCHELQHVKKLILINIVHIGNVKTVIEVFLNILDTLSISNIQCNYILYMEIKFNVKSMIYFK